MLGRLDDTLKKWGAPLAAIVGILSQVASVSHALGIPPKWDVFLARLFFGFAIFFALRFVASNPSSLISVESSRPLFPQVVVRLAGIGQFLVVAATLLLVYAAVPRPQDRTAELRRAWQTVVQFRESFTRNESASNLYGRLTDARTKSLAKDPSWWQDPEWAPAFVGKDFEKVLNTNRVLGAALPTSPVLPATLSGEKLDLSFIGDKRARDSARHFLDCLAKAEATRAAINPAVTGNASVDMNETLCRFLELMLTHDGSYLSKDNPFTADDEANLNTWLSRRKT